MAPRRPAEGNTRPRWQAITAGMLAVRGAASRLKANASGKLKPPPQERWQSDAWDVYDQVGEVKQATNFIADVVGGVRLFIGLREDPEAEPMPAPTGTAGALEAEGVLERLRTGSAHGGLGGLLTGSVRNLKVTGDCWLVGISAKPADPMADPPTPEREERWDVKSIDEVEIKESGEVTLKDTPGTGGQKWKVAGAKGVDPDDPDAVLLIRVYNRHPRFGGLADSSLRAALTECDELLMLSRAIRSAARSRFAGAGILAIPSELDLPGGPEEGDEGDDPEVTPLMRRLAQAMVEAVSDEGNPDSLVPLLLMGPGELLEKIQHIDFGQQFDPEARAIRAEILGRLGSILDIPVEQLTGIAKVNHWGAWQIDGASWARYGQPTTRLIVESWTEGLLWPALDEANVDRAAARKLVIWFDPADAIMDPDESKTADELFDRAAISWDAYRQRKGASDDEAPTDEELDRRSELGLLRGPGGNPAQPGQQGPPNDGETPEGPDAGARPSTNGHRPASVTAAATDPLGRRLMEIDRNCRARLEEAAEAALFRALQRAGAKVKSKAQGNPNISAAIAEVPNHRVCERLSPAILAAMELSEDDLLAGGVDDMGPRFDATVSKAQRQTRAALAAEFDLTEAELDALERAHDRDRHEAWAWLAGALLSLGRARLHDPGVSPKAGEFDASATVPPGLIRDAMARAGGGELGGGAPAGGVALGTTTLDLFRTHGQVVGGWEWVYGDASSRTTPFAGHEDLDGVQFANWGDPALLVRPEDDWLGVTHYRPGDHDWCQCDFIPLATDSPAPSNDDRVSDLMDELEPA